MPTGERAKAVEQLKKNPTLPRYFLHSLQGQWSAIQVSILVWNSLKMENFYRMLYFVEYIIDDLLDYKYASAFSAGRTVIKAAFKMSF